MARIYLAPVCKPDINKLLLKNFFTKRFYQEEKLLWSWDTISPLRLQATEWGAEEEYNLAWHWDPIKANWHILTLKIHAAFTRILVYKHLLQNVAICIQLNPFGGPSHPNPKHHQCSAHWRSRRASQDCKKWFPFNFHLSSKGGHRHMQKNIRIANCHD